MVRKARRHLALELEVEENVFCTVFPCLVFFFCVCLFSFFSFFLVPHVLDLEKQVPIKCYHIILICIPLLGLFYQKTSVMWGLNERPCAH